MKSFWHSTLYIGIGLFAAGLIWLASSQPRGEPIKLLTPPSPQPIQVHIIGEIQKPGVYTLPINSRVQDVIREAGGLTPNADTQTINLAAFLVDGQQIRIPAGTLQKDSDDYPHEGDFSERSPDQLPPLVNINTATIELLETLPGIGPVIAVEIIDFRQKEGDFLTIEEIQKVHGIGPIIFEGIKDCITVDNP